MDKRDRDPESDDGIVAEDLTPLVEHIELTSPQRLLDTPEWELATPAAELDDAPILVDEIGDDIPDLDAVSAGEDIELFTETQYDVGRQLPAGEWRPDPAAELAAERARWQKRVDSLLMSLAERDELLAERERQIEELSAKLATRTLEREGIAEELRAMRRDADLAASDDSLPRIEPEPSPAPELVADPAFDADPAPRAEAATEAAAEATAEEPTATLDNTAELPHIELPRPAPAPEAAPALRRYLIGVDLVGQVHEVTRHRVNIGRTHDNDLRILDPTVSRLHAMLTVRGGDATIVDANSKNGLFVNGIQVRYAKLEDGDLLTFGTVRFRYRVGTGTAGGSYASA
jgi:hypothetical protein